MAIKLKKKKNIVKGNYAIEGGKPRAGDKRSDAQIRKDVKDRVFARKGKIDKYNRVVGGKGRYYNVDGPNYKVQPPKKKNIVKKAR